MTDYPRRGAGMVRGCRVAALAVALACWPVPAAAEPATVLMDRVERANGTNSASAQLVVGGFDTNVVVFVSASGSARYNNALGGAGIVVSIDDGRDNLVWDDSFEGQSINMIYRASVSRTFVLRRGDRVALAGRTEPLGSQALSNQEARVRLEVVVIAAD
jgi:hypothetical protein